MMLYSTYGINAIFAGHTHSSDISRKGNITYYTTVSTHNDTHWMSSKPYPSAGYRIVQVINNKIISAEILETFSYFTGELTIQPIVIAPEIKKWLNY